MWKERSSENPTSERMSGKDHLKGERSRPWWQTWGQLRKWQGISMFGRTSQRKMCVWRYQQLENLRPKLHVVVFGAIDVRIKENL